MKPLAPPPPHTVSGRRVLMLRTAMGTLINAALDDPDVLEIMLNPDGRLWIDRLSCGRSPLGALPWQTASGSSAW